ncbi:MAG: HDIG domain-containing protein [bacterium]|jgi:putative nucleotidyltransferase with HDIG domain|nr:HDIG domain-containing protein [bacterium]
MVSGIILSEYAAKELLNSYYDYNACNRGGLMLFSLIGKIKNGDEEGRRFFCSLSSWNPRLFRLALAVAVIMIMASILSVQFMPDRTISRLQVGSVSPKEIRAPRSGRYADEADLMKRRQMAADAVADVYDPDPTALPSALTDLNSFYLAVSDARSSGQGATARSAKEIENSTSLKLSRPTVTALLQADPKVLGQLQRLSERLVRIVMAQGIRNSTIDLDVAESLIAREVKKTFLKERYTGAVAELVRAVMRPNRIYNSEKTEQARIQAQQRIKPVYVPISMNEIILEQYETVSARHVAMLKAVGLYQGEVNYATMAGLLFFTLINIMMVAYYICKYHPAVYASASALLLLSMTCVTGMLFSWLLSPILSGYMAILPVLSAVMLMAILFDTSLAMLMTASFSLSIGIIMNGQLQFSILSMISGCVAVFSVRRIYKNSDLVQAGIIVGLVSFVTIVAVSLINGEALSIIGMNALFGMISGIGSAIAVIGGLSFLEKPFGLTTHIHLLELCNPNEPLLKRLLTDAPGTYHHSIVVGNLAETAAEIVGADPLLTRVGAYYHDIGKIRRPYFFVENQMNQENVHEKISPHLSILVITAHIRDGVELAKQYRIPEKIVDIIAQHHGTNLILYFYHQAMNREEGNRLPENQFRYGGPKPRTREAALIMLADSVEAAVRSMIKPTPNKVEALVRKIIRDRLSDGQLDESELTFHDLSRIADAFIKVLNGIFHPRIEYPEAIEPRTKSGRRAIGVVK